MTIDVNVNSIDEEFLDNIDEIMEETMVQMFVLHPKSSQELQIIQEHADEYAQIFYSAPLTLKEKCDSNCVAYYVDDVELLKNSTNLDKTIFISEKDITAEVSNYLSKSEHRGIILNSTKTHPELNKFCISIGPKNINTFESDELEKLTMDSIVLESAYPEFGFDELFITSKKISDVIFRPDPSIIAQATKNSLILFGFKKV